MILLVAEVEELKANYDRQARGAVIEAKLDKNRGSVATLSGTKRGPFMLVITFWLVLSLVK